jgi:reactive intermediate/imine deaminase
MNAPSSFEQLRRRIAGALLFGGLAAIARRVTARAAEPPSSSSTGATAMTREIVHTDRAPKAIGTYSQAVRAGNTVYLSGQIPLDPKTMELVTGDIEKEIRQVFENLKAVAEASGGSLAKAVKVNVFLTDLAHFAKVNEVMAQYISQPYPARAAVGVAQLPRGARVEIECVLYLD